MLSIKPIGSSGKEVNYYAKLGDAENHDYYSEDGMRPGVWWGGGAKFLGLDGPVDSTVFRNLLEGLSPDGDRRLVQARQTGQVKRRAGFDLTYSMPKSFSVAWSQASRDVRSELDRRARRALYAALSTLEEFCGVTRRGKDGIVQENAKLVAAIFSHDTARGIPGEVADANRHFHAVIANVVVRADGTTGALDARPLFQRRMKMALGALFRAELSKELEDLGLKTERPMKPHKDERASWFEIACVPPRLIESMSKRRRQIQKWLGDHGLSGAKAAERAALRTRQDKEQYSQFELFAAWRKLGKKYGFTRKELEDGLSSADGRKFDYEAEKRGAVSRGLETLTEKKARFTEVELLELTAVEAQCRGIGIADIREAVDTCLAQSEELVRLQNENGIRTFTTKSMLQLERSMMRMAAELNSVSCHAVSLTSANAILSEYSSLRNEQAEAIRVITTGSDIACVSGVAGSGKTFMLGVAREIWERNGHHVLGTALAAKASSGLENGSGIKSIHLHKLLKEIERGRVSLCQNSIVVLDESGMVGTRQMEQLISLVVCSKAKLVLVGDWKQLQAIDAGAAFRGIAETVGYCSLEEIIRQREEWARAVVQNLRDGEALLALKRLHDRGQLYIGLDREDAVERLVLDWREKAIEGGELRETLAFAGTSIEVRELNQRIQAELIDAGKLGKSSIDIGGFEIRPGDRVMITQNKPVLCLRNGQVADVVGIEGTVASLRLDDGMTIEVDTNEFDQLTLGYAMTAHKGQGVTCENALILTGDGMTDRELSYVESSRARGLTKMYSDVATGKENIQELAALMNRSRQKELAHEYVIEGA